MKLPYGYVLVNEEIIVHEEKADAVRSIFEYYLAGASLGKIVDMLHAKGIPSPSGNPKWGRAAVDKLLSNAKYIPIVGMRTRLKHRNQSRIPKKGTQNQAPCESGLK